MKDAAKFAAAIYKIMLRYGIVDLLITDADSKFRGKFKKVGEILKMKHHPVARGKYDLVLVERFNRMLNFSLMIFNNDRSKNRVFVKGALMTAYAWNSTTLAGMSLS